MLIMPVMFIRLGVKWMLALGMFGWVLRYVLFALGAPDAVLWMVMGGILLHGLCYDFFFVAGQIYVDKLSRPELRGQAQGFLILVTYGVGMLIGAQVAGAIFDSVFPGGSAESMAQWQTFWLIPAAFALAVLLFFIALFNDRLRMNPAAIDTATVARDAAIEPNP